MTLLDQITVVADTLTEPQLNREPYTQWVNRHRKVRHHITVQPGLLTQLYQAVIPVWSSGDMPAGGVPGSRPPLAVEALSRHDEICMAVLHWCTTLGLTTRVSAESNVRALVGAAGRLDHDQAGQLLADLRRWRGWCNVYLGLEQVRQIPGVRCPLSGCSRRGTLRVNLTTATAICAGCGATWNSDTIGLLGEHIRTSRKGAAA